MEAQPESLSPPESEFRGSAGDFAMLLESPAWLDIEERLNEGLDRAVRALEVAEDFRTMLRLQKEIEDLRQFINMPRSIHDELLEMQKERHSQDSLD